MLKHSKQNVNVSSYFIPKVVKSATKILKKRLTNINLKPKNDLDHVFCMYKEGNSKVFKSKFWQIWGLRSSLWTSIKHILTCGVGSAVKSGNRNFIFFRENSDFPCLQITAFLSLTTTNRWQLRMLFTVNNQKDKNK